MHRGWEGAELTWWEVIYIVHVGSQWDIGDAMFRIELYCTCLFNMDTQHITCRICTSTHHTHTHTHTLPHTHIVPYVMKNSKWSHFYDLHHSICVVANAHRTIVALVYNVLKTMMSINSKLFDDLTNSYKADKQK